MHSAITTAVVAAVLASAPRLGAAAAEPEAPRLALLPLEAINLESGEAKRYWQRVVRELFKRRRFQIINPARVEKALRGRASECARQVPCLRDLGRALEAQLLLALRVGRLGETMVVQLRAFDVARAARVGAWEEILRQAHAPAAVNSALDRMVDRFAPARQIQRTPWYKRWWVWTVAGAVVAGAVTTTVLVTRSDGASQPDWVIRPPP